MTDADEPDHFDLEAAGADEPDAWAKLYGDRKGEPLTPLEQETSAAAKPNPRAGQTDDHSSALAAMAQRLVAMYKQASRSDDA